MIKEEMVTLLNSAGVTPPVIEAMTNAYTMGFEYGAKSYVHLTEVMECAVAVAKQVDLGDLDGAKEASTNFWSAVDDLRGME